MTAIVTEAVTLPASALERSRAGSHDAFAELVAAHQSMVFSIAYRFFNDPARAEEAAQDVFLQLYRNVSDIESEAHLIHWLRQVTSRRCIDLLRRTRLHAVSLDSAAELPARTTSSDPMMDRRVRRHVATLPEMQRLILTLRYQEDLDPMEICTIVKLPVNTVKSYLHRALVSLRKKLGER
jgi:RNA polymerase sigma-70 factor (ECF subfamily)